MEENTIQNNHHHMAEFILVEQSLSQFIPKQPFIDDERMKEWILCLEFHNNIIPGIEKVSVNCQPKNVTNKIGFYESLVRRALRKYVRAGKIFRHLFSTPKNNHQYP